MDSRLTLDDAERVHTLSVMNEFCRALADPGAGERLHQLHAADALLQGDTHLQPAAEIEPRRFASAHHAISTSTQAHPQFDEVVLLRIDCQAAPERVAWFEVTEKRTLLKLRIGVGLRALADELRIGWCTLTANPADWSYQEGFRQSLAD